MLSIALCDDETQETAKTTALLEEYKLYHSESEYTLKYYNNMESLVNAIQFGEIFDLLLLDIYMDKQNGIEGALKLRQMGFSGDIMFLTTSKDHALSAFGVNAQQYLLKPIEKESFFPALHKVFSENHKERCSKIILQIGRETTSLFVRDIVYCETKKNTQLINLKQGDVISSRLTRDELFKTLSPHREFTKMGASYILNLDFIQNLTSKEINLRTGISISVPRGSYSNIRREYIDFFCGGANHG